MPGGGIVTREVVEHFGAVAIVAMDDNGNIPMVYQYRHTYGRRLWELPAGLLDVAGEPPHLTAARELREEVGLQASTWQVLVDLDTAPASATNRCGSIWPPDCARWAGPKPITKKPT